MERELVKSTVFRILDGILDGEGISDDDINDLNLAITLCWEFINVYSGNKLKAEADKTHDMWFGAFNLEKFDIDEEVIDRIKVMATSADKIMFRINYRAYEKLHNEVISRLNRLINEANNENETTEASTETCGAEEVTA